MLARVVSLFEANRRPVSDRLVSLILSDYLAYYRERDESPRRLALLFLPRLAHNPALHAAALIRIAVRGPRVTLGLWRTLLIAKHSIDIEREVEIGPGLVLPHPLGIVIGWGVQIGARATILHNVTLGGVPRWPEAPMRAPKEDVGRISPAIGDGVTIYTQSVVVGPIAIGDGAVLGAMSWVDKDVPAGATISGRAIRRG